MDLPPTSTGVSECVTGAVGGATGRTSSSTQVEEPPPKNLLEFSIVLSLRNMNCMRQTPLPN